MRIGSILATSILCAAMCAAATVLGASLPGTPVIDRLIPASNEIAGWARDGEPLRYGAEGLWEYIDGSAENFLSFDFREVAVQDYLSGAGAGLKVEIYEHASPLMAYGIYAQMRSPDLAFLDIGNEAFADEYSVNFWKGPFYVRVAVFDVSEELDAAMKTFASAIAAKIPEAGSLPPEVSCFPADGLVARDTRYLTQGVLGREKYPPAFVATYRWENETAKLYLSPLADSAAARAAYDWYAREAPGESRLVEAAGGTCLQSTCKDPYQGAVMSFQFGRWFGALVGLEKPEERGARLIEKTIENLKKIE